MKTKAKNVFFLIRDSDQCLRGLAAWCLPGQREARVWLPVEAQNFFQIVSDKRPTVTSGGQHISELRTHEDMLSSWRGECDSDQCLGSLVVMMLTRLATGVRFPTEAQNFWDRVTYSTHCYRSLLQLNVNIKFDSLWTHLEPMSFSLSLLPQYKRTLIRCLPITFFVRNVI